MTIERNPIMAMFASDLAIAAEKQDMLISCINGLAKNPHLDEMLAETSAAPNTFWPDPDSWKAQYRPYVVQDGILHIPVKGMLLHNFPWADGNWATGYDYIQRAFERGMKDEGVRAIAFIAHSGGGLVAGCWDAVDKMYALKQEFGKPVRAFAHEYAYSAAYGVISLADHIAMSRTGGVGSIGTRATHIDWSKFNERMGLTLTHVAAGKHKLDGDPDAPLSDAAKARMQERVDEFNEIFVSSVARNRGMDEQTLRNFEALTFTASKAVSNGLADSIGSLEDALVAYATDLSSTSGEEEMSTPKEAVDQAAHDSAVATARAEGVEQGKKDGQAEGAKAERARIDGIIASDAGKKRPMAALATALKSDMSLEQATAFLADLAEEKSEAPANKEEGKTFTDVMNNSEHPNLGQQGGEGGEKKTDAQSILADQASYTGAKPKKN